MPPTLRHPLLIATAALALLGLSHAHAGKAVMAELCHFDAESGTYKKISVPTGTALDKHMQNHGDITPGQMFEGVGLDENCALREAKVFARAYIDVDPSDVGYSSDDIDIAVVMDGDNGNGVLDAGDLLYLFQYPKSFTPLAGGENDGVNEFIGDSPLVVSDAGVSDSALAVKIGSYSISIFKTAEAEGIAIRNVDINDALVIIDWLSTSISSRDRIFVSPDLTGEVPWIDPSVRINLIGDEQVEGELDDAYIDVEIYP